MELPSVGSADLLRPVNPGKENVTLISYNPNKVKSNPGSHYSRQRKFVPNQASNNYVVSSSALGSQCKRSEKFNFKAFRKRSKSASRLDESQKHRTPFQGSQSNLLDLKDESPVPDRLDLIQHRDSRSEVKNNQDKSQVKLVGFINNTSEFSLCGSNSNTEENNNNNNTRFTTLKTSREVKMERERLRQEKLHRLTQVQTLSWDSGDGINSIFQEKVYVNVKI